MRGQADITISRDSDFHFRLARQQASPYLRVGCTDSGVAANETVGLPNVSLRAYVFCASDCC